MFRISGPLSQILNTILAEVALYKSIIMEMLLV